MDKHNYSNHKDAQSMRTHRNDSTQIQAVNPRNSEHFQNDRYTSVQKEFDPIPIQNLSVQTTSTTTPYNPGSNNVIITSQLLSYLSSTRETRAIFSIPAINKKDDFKNFLIMPLAAGRNKTQILNALHTLVQEKNHGFKISMLTKCIRQYGEFSRSNNLGNLSTPDITSCVQSLCMKLLDTMTRVDVIKSFTEIPYLNTGCNGTIFMTKFQAFVILCNAFFCTFPEKTPINTLPWINFASLYNQESDSSSNLIKIEKLKCIFYYFEKMLETTSSMENNQILSFQRRCVKPLDFPKWSKSKKSLAHVQVKLDGRIENCLDYVRVDFANKYVGGGILGRGAVMEEILFSICPELIVSRLFVEKLDDNEALVVNGVEQYANYQGYGSGFRFTRPSPISKQKKIDEFGRIYSEIVMIDAIDFSKRSGQTDQYKNEYINRELNKCFCGFGKSDGNLPNGDQRGIATGNWGCGVFSGDPELKFLIQLMAISEVERPTMLMHSNDPQEFQRFNSIVEFLTKQSINVGQLYNGITSFIDHKQKYNTVFDYIIKDPYAFAPRTNTGSFQESFQRVPQASGNVPNYTKSLPNSNNYEFNNHPKSSAGSNNVFEHTSTPNATTSSGQKAKNLAIISEFHDQLQKFGKITFSISDWEKSTITEYVTNNGREKTRENKNVIVMSIKKFEHNFRLPSFGFPTTKVHEMYLWVRASKSIIQKIEKREDGVFVSFYDRFCKTQDERSKPGEVQLSLLCKVALGNDKKCKMWNHRNGMPYGHESVKIRGRMIPDWSENKKKNDENNAIFPCGVTKVDHKNEPHGQEFNEYIVDSLKQVKIAYIVETTMT